MPGGVEPNTALMSDLKQIWSGDGSSLAARWPVGVCLVPEHRHASYRRLRIVRILGRAECFKGCPTSRGRVVGDQVRVVLARFPRAKGSKEAGTQSRCSGLESGILCCSVDLPERVDPQRAPKAGTSLRTLPKGDFWRDQARVPTSPRPKGPSDPLKVTKARPDPTLAGRLLP